ncbi:MAG: type II toxin-antitoxin system HicB family antitoxin [Dehalococcoidia bacterium]|nr:type II toxin-antitoxin system HicB family antitoxin [Dehalococcoidia bacterium]
MKIDTDAIFEAFQRTLALVDDAERQRLERILHASQDSVQRAVVDLVRAIAEEVNAAASHLHAEVAYGPDGPEFTVDAAPAAEEGASIEFEFDTGEIERLTLRLPSELKELAALAAEQHGVSLNTWLTRLVSREAARRAAPERGRERERRGGPGSRGGRGPGQSLKGWIGG